MKYAPEHLHLSEKNFPKIWLRSPKATRPLNWESIDCAVVPLERSLHGHPVAGLLWEESIGKVLREEGWEEAPG